MFVLYANKTQLTIHQKEPLTSGSVKVYQVRFEFSPEWDGLTRTACFQSGVQTISVLLDETGRCDIPWEVTDLGDSGRHLFVGVYGSDISGVVLPTVWADCGLIQQGVQMGGLPRPPTPGPIDVVMQGKGDTLGYTPDGELGLYAGARLLSAVPIQTNDPGTSDHRELANRDAEEQHPIGAITGLERELSKRLTEDNAMSVVDIIKIMEE